LRPARPRPRTRWGDGKAVRTDARRLLEPPAQATPAHAAFTQNRRRRRSRAGCRRSKPGRDLRRPNLALPTRTWSRTNAGSTHHHRRPAVGANGSGGAVGPNQQALRNYNPSSTWRSAALEMNHLNLEIERCGARYLIARI